MLKLWFSKGKKLLITGGGGRIPHHLENNELISFLITIKLEILDLIVFQPFHFGFLLLLKWTKICEYFTGVKLFTAVLNWSDNDNHVDILG